MYYLILHSDAYEPDGNWSAVEATAPNEETAVKMKGLEDKGYLRVYNISPSENGGFEVKTKVQLDL